MKFTPRLLKRLLNIYFRQHPGRRLFAGIGRAGLVLMAITLAFR
jgi:hypothetical protein